MAISILLLFMTVAPIIIAQQIPEITDLTFFNNRNEQIYLPTVNATMKITCTVPPKSNVELYSFRGQPRFVASSARSSRGAVFDVLLGLGDVEDSFRCCLPNDMSSCSSAEVHLPFLACADDEYEHCSPKCIPGKFCAYTRNYTVPDPCYEPENATCFLRDSSTKMVDISWTCPFFYCPLDRPVWCAVPYRQYRKAWAIYDVTAVNMTSCKGIANTSIIYQAPEAWDKMVFLDSRTPAIEYLCPHVTDDAIAYCDMFVDGLNATKRTKGPCNRVIVVWPPEDAFNETTTGRILCKKVVQGKVVARSRIYLLFKSDDLAFGHEAQSSKNASCSFDFSLPPNFALSDPESKQSDPAQNVSEQMHACQAKLSHVSCRPFQQKVELITASGVIPSPAASARPATATKVKTASFSKSTPTKSGSPKSTEPKPQLTGSSVSKSAMDGSSKKPDGAVNQVSTGTPNGKSNKFPIWAIIVIVLVVVLIAAAIGALVVIRSRKRDVQGGYETSKSRSSKRDVDKSVKEKSIQVVDKAEKREHSTGDSISSEMSGTKVTSLLAVNEPKKVVEGPTPTPKSTSTPKSTPAPKSTTTPAAPVEKTMKEKSKTAAKVRRENENNEFGELGQLLPLPSAITSQLDKASVIRLTGSYLHMRALFPNGLRSYYTPVEFFDFPEIKELGSQLMQVLTLEGFVFILSPDGRVVYISETASVHLGLSQVELTGNNIFDYLHMDDRAQMAALLQGDANVFAPQTLSGSQDYEIEKTLTIRMRCIFAKRHAGLTYRDYKVVHCTGYQKFKVCHNTSGAPMVQNLGLVAMGTTVPASPATEYRLSASSFLLRGSLDFKIIFTDPKVPELTGYNPQELIDRSLYSYINTNDLVIVRQAHKTLLEKSQAVTTYYRFWAKNGCWLWVQSQLALIYSTRSSEPHCIVCISHVISRDYTCADAMNTGASWPSCSNEILNCSNVSTNNLNYATTPNAALQVGAYSEHFYGPNGILLVSEAPPTFSPSSCSPRLQRKRKVI